MNFGGINASVTQSVQPQENQWVEETRETPSAKSAEKLRGKTVTRQIKPQTIQGPQSAGEASVNKINEERVKDILRAFSKEISHFWRS